MRKMIWLTIITVLFAVFLLPGLLALFIRYIPFNNQPSLQQVKNIYGKYSISQEFTSQESDLVGIGMTIKNPNLKNKQDFYLYLYDDQGTMLRSVKYNGSNVEDGSYLKFMFDPIPDSRGKIYKVALTNPNVGEEQLLGVYYTLDKPDWIGQMMFETNLVDGGISLVTYHKPKTKLQVVRQIYANWFSRVL